MDLQSYLSECQERVNRTLLNVLPDPKTIPAILHEAMHYAVMGGGKRIRPAYVYATGEALHANSSVLDICSAAIELIHAFSLVHDDLPALDNDELRHGKPSLHQAYGEGLAILAGDALLTLAFEVLTNLVNYKVPSVTILQMVKLLSHYAGSCGMAGGEVLDILSVNHVVTLEKLAMIYELKTSYLFCVSIIFGALAANCVDENVLNNLERFGIYLGLAFQIHDDVIGVEQSTKVLGKPQHSDEINNKPTYPQLIGLKESKSKEREYFDMAIQYLEKTNIEREKLIALSKYIIRRSS